MSGTYVTAVDLLVLSFQDRFNLKVSLVILQVST